MTRRGASWGDVGVLRVCGVMGCLKSMYVCMYSGIAAMEVRHVFCLLCLLAVFADISLVGTIVNVFESVEMPEKLKRLRKEALDTGKIKFRKETGIDFDHDGVIQLEGTLEQKIKELNRK